MKMKNEGMTYAGYRLWRILGMRLFLISTFVFLIPHFSFLICFAQDTNRNYDAFFLDAVCQRNLGNNDAAFDLLRHCVEIDSTRSEAYFYLTPYYSMIKDKEKAIYCIKKAVALEPDNATYLETMANAYITQREYDEAAATLERLYEKNSERDDILAVLVQLYEQTGNYDKAITTLTKIETAEGKSERLSVAKSELYTQMNDRKAAIREMKLLADQYPGDPNYRCLYANTLYNNGQEKQALAMYSEIMNEYPDNRNALMGLLSHYHQANDSVRVMQLFRQALQRPNPDAQTALYYASYMNMKKMPQDSISPVLERVLKISPDNAAVRLQLVSYAWQKEDKERVISLCSEARQYNPEEMAFYYYQGIACYQKGLLDDALDAFKNGISVINAESDPAIVSDFYAVMGDILHQKGMEKEAYAAYDSCLVWKEDNIGCLNNYAYYLSEQGEQLDKAEQMSYRTIKAEPKNATYLDTYAWILFMQQRYSEAKIYIDQTLQCDSDSSAVLLEHAGDIYYHIGDKEKAVSLWQQALDKSAENSEIKDERKQVLIRKIKLKKYLKE